MVNEIRNSVNSIEVKTLRNSLNYELYYSSGGICPEGEPLYSSNAYYTQFYFTEPYLGILETMTDGFVDFSYPTLYTVNPNNVSVYFQPHGDIPAENRSKWGIYLSYLTITR